MKTAFEELSSKEIAAAIEQNGFDFFLSLVTPLQAEVYEDAQILRVITKLPFSLLNVVLRTHFESEEIDNKIEAVLALPPQRDSRDLSGSNLAGVPRAGHRHDDDKCAFV